jgi:glycosyltransferase involved in cell wall biosynthesis
MKIAFYSFPNFAHGGGFEKYIMSLASELANLGHDVSIITINRKWQYWLEVVLSFFYLKPRSKFPDKFRLSKSQIDDMTGNKVILREVSSLKQFREELIHNEIIYSKNEILDLLILKYFILRGVNHPPIHIGVHTPIFYPITKTLFSKIHNFLYLGYFYENLLLCADGIHVLNSDDKKLIQNFNKVQKRCRKIYYVNHYYDVASKVKIYEGNSNGLVVGFIGRLTEQKGVDILVEIVDKLSTKEEFKNIIFNIAGSGELKNEIIAIKEKYPSNIFYKGFILPEKINQFYLESDVILVPSRWETVSYVCLEANSMGIPVIVSDIPGPRDVIIQNKTGYFVAPGDIDGFVKAIIKFYRLKKEYNNEINFIQNNCTQNIKDNFSKYSSISKILLEFDRSIS